MTENEIAKQIVLKRCEEDLIFFAKTLNSKAFYLPTPEFHKEMAALFMDRTKKQVLDQAPRGFAKSTLSIFFILHHIVFDPGNKVIILQSKTRDEAANRLDTIKNLLEHSKEFKALFGYAGQYSPKTKTWTNHEIKTSLGGQSIYIKAIGSGMPARGKMASGEDLDMTRITLYFVDDPEDEDNTKTPEAMFHNLDKFLGNAAGMDMRTGRAIVIGTPITGGCMVQKLEESTGWHSHKYQAWWKECECEHQSDPLVSTCEKCGEDISHKSVKLLWEDMRNEQWLRDKLEEFRSQGNPSKFYSEYMCRTVGNEDQLFKKEYLNYYEGWLETEKVGHDYECYIHVTSEKGEKLKEEKKIPVNTFLGVDPASSTSQRADFTVVFPIGYDSEGRIYCLPYLRKRLTPAGVAEGIIDKVKLTRPRKGGIETTGYQEMLRETVREMMNANDCYVSGFDVGQGFNPRTDKNKRLERLHNYFYQRKVWVIKSEHSAFIDELLSYPRGSHDDTLDAFDYATRRMYKPDHEENAKSEEDWSQYPSLGFQNKDNWVLS